MAALSVNLNKFALLRNSRGQDAPDLLHIATQLVELGVNGLTVHPRADRRHILAEDARMLRQLASRVEINLEGDLREEFLDLVEETRPTQCTLVPVTPGEVTSHRGWDVARHAYVLEGVIAQLQRWGIRVALFLEANPTTAQAVAALRPDRVELYTGPYAHAFRAQAHTAHLAALAATAADLNELGIDVNAGHDLTVANLVPLLAAVPSIREVSIGHYLMLEALQVGLPEAVRRFFHVCQPVPAQ